MGQVNGHFKSHAEPESGLPPHPLDGVVTDVVSGGAIMEMKTGLFGLGRNRARDSGATKPVAEDQKALEETARAMARETYREAFDPAKHAHDRKREDEYQAQLSQRTEAQQGAAHGRANLRDAENKLAKTPKAGERPTIKPWLVPAAIVAITLSIAPTLHDSFFSTLSDDVLAWLFAIIGAGFVALFLALSIIHGRRTAAHRVGLIAGVLIGVALGAIRFSSAENLGGCVFAVGLSVFEIAAVLLLEWTATGLRDAEAKWLADKKIEDEAGQLRDVAQTDLNRWTARLEEINKSICAHIAYVEDRATRNLQVSELETVAVKAVLDGYNAGIAENLGRILGVRRAQ